MIVGAGGAIWLNPFATVLFSVRVPENGVCVHISGED